MCEYHGRKSECEEGSTQTQGNVGLAGKEDWNIGDSEGLWDQVVKWIDWRATRGIIEARTSCQCA